MTRLPESPSSLLNRGRPLSFTYNGRRIEAFEGDTVASALLAAGVNVVSRSFKYHRPRGLLCCEGHCPNCMMNVDSSPNVRSCTEPVRDGMVVKHQNAWPSPEFDVLAATEWFGAFMPVGFYYKVFHKPRELWPYFEHFIRKIAGLGVVDPVGAKPYTYDKQHLRADVAVVGGGPAGLAAALAAAEAGASVTLVEKDSFLGGHFRFQHPGSADFKKAAELEAQVRRTPNIRLLLNATAFGVYEGNLMGVVQGRRMIRLRARRIVLATGIIERPFVFGNNDLPGVMLGRAVQRLIHLHQVKPGNRAVVVGSNDRAVRVAADLQRAGIELVAYADHRASLDASSLKTQVLTATTAVSAQGSGRLAGVTLAPMDGKTGGQPYACDLLVLSTGGDPAIHLVQQAGARGTFDERRQEFLAQKLPENYFVAGDCNGIHDPASLVPDGRRAGLAAAGSAANGSSISDQMVLNSASMVAGPGDGKRFVCVCEDVTEKDVYDAVNEGFDGVETLKRYSTISMGPCQGKMCQMSAIGLCARATGRTIEETGSTTARPPYTPVTLGALTGRNYHPHKTVSTHSRHVALKAKMINLGDWMRPEMYTTADDESRAVHERVGVIDVSTLGRIDLRGADVVKMLDKVYLNSWGSLQVGRTRYGVMCDESGIIFDDGTCARLGDSHYLMTTTTSGVEGVYQWLTSYLVGSGWDVCVTNVTGGYGGVNLAGPRARDVLKKLTSINLDSRAFPYMGCAQGKVAEVDCILFRIGFVGELGYEIHFPAEYGEHMWDAVMEAGREFNIRPFGVETQRILRLQKKHIIIGQDTDALSNPFDAELGWMVKLDKPDFIGRRSLLSAKDRKPQQLLVGFASKDTSVPEEGNQVVENGRSVGRVTSARFSPYLNQTIGLAWVPAARAKEGETVQIRVRGVLQSAQVVLQPFYDPSGGRMKA